MSNDNIVYLASPWFNKHQSEREIRIKNELRRIGFTVHSPRENSDISPITDKNVREKIFNDNINALKKCSYIFAITDEKDVGTIWEAGYIFGYRNLMQELYVLYEMELGDFPLVIYYCETLGDNLFNLMLAESGDIIITDFNELENLPEKINKIKKGEKIEYVGNVE